MRFSTSPGVLVFAGRLLSFSLLVRQADGAKIEGDEDAAGTTEAKEDTKTDDAEAEKEEGKREKKDGKSAEDQVTEEEDEETKARTATEKDKEEKAKEEEEKIKAKGNEDKERRNDEEEQRAKEEEQRQRMKNTVMEPIFTSLASLLDYDANDTDEKTFEVCLV